MMNPTVNSHTDRWHFCYTLYKNCRSQIGRNESVFETECGRNFTRQCPSEPSSRRGTSITRQLQLPTILLILFILIAVSSFLANGFVCVVYSLSKEIRTAKHYFIVNLAAADILIAVFAIPLYLTQYVDDESKKLCQVGSMVDVLCCTSSIISFTVMSTERFVAVKYPLRYQTIVARKHCLMVLSFVWTYSIAFSLASWIPVGKHDKTHCVFFSDAYIIFTTFASFLLPLLVMLVTYGWIYKVASYQSRQISNSMQRGGNRARREFKAAKTLTLIVGAFVVCWLPFFCYIWVFSLYQIEIPFYNLHYIVQIVRFLNSLVNPFIYVSVNREFRRSTFKLLKRMLPQRERLPSETNESSQTTEIVLRKISGTSLGVSCCS